MRSGKEKDNLTVGNTEKRKDCGEGGTETHPCGSFLNWGDGSVREELDKHELDHSTHVNRLDVVACSFTPAPGRWRHRSPQESLVIQPRGISDL